MQDPPRKDILETVARGTLIFLVPTDLVRAGSTGKKT